MSANVPSDMSSEDADHPAHLQSPITFNHYHHRERFGKFLHAVGVVG